MGDVEQLGLEIALLGRALHRLGRQAVPGRRNPVRVVDAVVKERAVAIVEKATEPAELYPVVQFDLAAAGERPLVIDWRVAVGNADGRVPALAERLRFAPEALVAPIVEARPGMAKEILTTTGLSVVANLALELEGRFLRYPLQHHVDSARRVPLLIRREGL